MTPHVPLVPWVTARKSAFSPVLARVYSVVSVLDRFDLRSVALTELVIAISAAHCGVPALVPPT